MVEFYSVRYPLFAEIYLQYGKNHYKIKRINRNCMEVINGDFRKKVKIHEKGNILYFYINRLKVELTEDFFKLEAKNRRYEKNVKVNEDMKNIESMGKSEAIEKIEEILKKDKDFINFYNNIQIGFKLYESYSVLYLFYYFNVLQEYYFQISEKLLQEYLREVNLIQEEVKNY